VENSHCSCAVLEDTVLHGAVVKALERVAAQARMVRAEVFMMVSVDVLILGVGMDGEGVSTL